MHRSTQSVYNVEMRRGRKDGLRLTSWWSGLRGTNEGFYLAARGKQGSFRFVAGITGTASGTLLRSAGRVGLALPARLTSWWSG